ncbi:MAG TPA: hypothetical protein VM305_01490 [Candidatus Limnocylindrales bacterium]|nr:hypothetical protein [Candidatus Limnocylindrales bacterium]
MSNSAGATTEATAATNEISPREARTAIAEQVGRLDFEDVRSLARLAERQLMSGATGSDATTPLLFADAQGRLLEDIGDEAAAEYQSARDLARRQMANRLREFPRLRADRTFKTAINAALGNLVFALTLSDRISGSDFNALTAPWRSVTGWPTERSDR